VNPKTIRAHRLLGFAAVLHALLIVTAWIGWLPPHTDLLWVPFTTLWLVWPVVLIAHPGRSVLRVAAPLLISLLILSRVSDEYCFKLPVVLGFPPGVHLGRISDYLSARKAGRAEAMRDLNDGRLVIETYGFPMPAGYEKILHDRYRIELRRIADDTNVTEKVLGHAGGYNEVSEREITRRFGDGVIEEAADEALRPEREKSNQPDR
jgi:hypothetical protein